MTKLDRKQKLNGKTYKIKPPIIEEAVYITINDAEVDGQLRPIEVFINSKHMESFQWISCTTRLLSASFRQDGPFPDFIIGELLETFDPKGAYFIPGTGKKVNSIVAHIGMILEEHCKEIGLLPVKKKKEEQDGNT